MNLNPLIRKILTVALAAIGIGAMIYYLRCQDSCAYLKGSLLGIDLKFIGISFMLLTILLSLMGWDALLRIGLATGIGGEIFLIGYQFAHNVFCPYCLTFALTVILAFIVNFKAPHERPPGWRRLAYLLGDVQLTTKGRLRRYPLLAFTLLGLLFFMLAFTGSAVPVFAAESPMPAVYGGGNTEIRIYTDYFCQPCQGMENDAEKLLDRIIAKKRARVLFIDTPIHNETPLYARYFLYATCNDTNYERAKDIRKIFIAAARAGIVSESALINYLKQRGITMTLCPATAYFHVLENYLKEDNIHATPTCVIITKEGKRTYNGPQPILDALAAIAKKS